MMLHARWQGQRLHTNPVLVWLHGFLGCADDWQNVQRAFSDWPLLSLDLPGHGGSSGQRVSGFDELSQRLRATLVAHRVERYWLIGYSLGGRVAMYHACRGSVAGLCGLVVEAGHPGLRGAAEKRARKEHDRRWSERFRTQPLRQTLDAWYRQPLFAGLTETQRQDLIHARAGGNARALADMLEATSLSQQPDLLPELQNLRLPFHYLCGEEDSKFQRLAQDAGLPLHSVAAAGHNAHRANPGDFAQRLARLLHHA